MQTADHGSNAPRSGGMFVACTGHQTAYVGIADIGAEYGCFEAATFCRDLKDPFDPARPGRGF